MSAKKFDYDLYKATCLAKGEAPMSQDDFDKQHAEPDGDEGKGGKGDNDGDEGKNDMSKSATDGADRLSKALETFDTVMDAADERSVSREVILKSRLDSGVITGQEKAELSRIWLGQAEPGSGDSVNVRKSLTDYLDEDGSKIVDASPLLKSLFDGMDARLAGVEGNHLVEQRTTRDMVKSLAGLVREEGAGLVKALTLLGDVTKALDTITARLEGIETTPVSPRAVIVKSRDAQPRKLGEAAGGGADPKALTKAQVTGAMRLLMKAADDAGDSPLVSRLADATIRYDSTGELDAANLAAVRAVLAG